MAWYMQFQMRAEWLVVFTILLLLLWVNACYSTLCLCLYLSLWLSSNSSAFKLITLNALNL